MKCFLYQQKSFLIKETDTFGNIVLWTIYTCNIDYFTPQHTAFEQSAACLSVFLELLPGLIPFAILWHAMWTLQKTFSLTWTTIIWLQYLEVFWPKYMYFWYYLQFFIFTMNSSQAKNVNIYFSTRNLSIWAKILLYIVVLTIPRNFLDFLILCHLIGFLSRCKRIELLTLSGNLARTKLDQNLHLFMVTWPRWPPHPYKVKSPLNYLNSIGTWYAALGMLALPSSDKWWFWVDIDLFYNGHNAHIW